jgi:hypothetical protein
MSNVSRHMQSCHANGSAVKHSFVLRACAAWRSAVGYRKAQLAQPLRRAARPAAGGAPIVEAPPEQRPASCRAVRPSAASAPVRKRAGQQSCFVPALRVRSACAVSFLRHGRHRPSTAHAGVGVGSIRRMQMPQALRSRNRHAVCEQNTVTANPSIERTPYGMLRMPPVAAHVER